MKTEKEILKAFIPTLAETAKQIIVDLMDESEPMEVDTERIKEEADYLFKMQNLYKCIESGEDADLSIIGYDYDKEACRTDMLMITNGGKRAEASNPIVDRLIDRIYS